VPVDGDQVMLKLSPALIEVKLSKEKGFWAVAMDARASRTKEETVGKSIFDILLLLLSL